MCNETLFDGFKIGQHDIVPKGMDKIYVVILNTMHINIVLEASPITKAALAHF